MYELCCSSWYVEIASLALTCGFPGSFQGRLACGAPAGLCLQGRLTGGAHGLTMGTCSPWCASAGWWSGGRAGSLFLVPSTWPIGTSRRSKIVKQPFWFISCTAASLLKN